MEAVWKRIIERSIKQGLITVEERDFLDRVKSYQRCTDKDKTPLPIADLERMAAIMLKAAGLPTLAELSR